MTARVNCAGVAVQDLIYRVAKLPHGDGKITAHHRQEVGGGMAATAATAVARLGGASRWFGRLGQDELGGRILHDLLAEGVQAPCVLRVPGVMSSHSVVLIDDEGHRLVVMFRPLDLPGGTDWLDMDLLLDCDAVLADIRWPEGAAHALAAARRHGLPAVLDADSATHASYAAPLAAATHAVFSQAGLREASGTADPAEGLQRIAAQTDGFVAVTLGAEGVAWLEGGQLHRMAAHKIAVRDTLGAGDVFHGAFALALAERQSLHAALAFANAAAALKCSKPGGRAGIPSRAEVGHLLASAPPPPIQIA